MRRRLASLLPAVREAWRRLRAWRRISFTPGGLAFTVGTFAVGFAALNTGNNLLYLLLGAMLGFITVSGWLSERAIRGLVVERLLPRAVTVGHDLRTTYRVTNTKARFPSLAVELVEQGLPGRAFLAHVAAGETVEARSVNSFVHRGTYALHSLTLATAFPFGLFLKEHDIPLPGEVVVWPRTDRAVQMPLPRADRTERAGAATRGTLGYRGEYRSLRVYRSGDDPRDIHWRSSARLREPVLREYEHDGARTRWICLDLRCQPGAEAEVAVELVAAVAARAAAEGVPFALVAGDVLVDPGEGPGQLERVLDVLARVDFHPEAPASEPPVELDACVLVQAGSAA